MIPALFTLGGTFLTQHLEHNFQATMQQTARLDKRIDTKSKLLSIFVSNSSELLALRGEVLLSKANVSVRTQIDATCEHRRASGPRIASLKLLPDGVVASPKMLPTIGAVTMPPPLPRRGYGYQDDTHGAG